LPPDKLNKVIHQRMRLMIMSALAARGELSFNELKRLTGASDGNLSVHASVLEEHGYIKSKKRFSQKKPLTTFAITGKGRSEFKRYVEAMREILLED